MAIQSQTRLLRLAPGSPSPHDAASRHRSAGDDKLGHRGIMQGSFDTPPIIIQQSKVKLGLNVLLAVGVVSVCYWLFGTTAPASIADGMEKNAIIVALALFAAFQVWTFFQPNVLEIGPEGLVWRKNLRTCRYAWSDFDGFVVTRNSRGWSQYPDAVFSKDAQRRPIAALLWSDTAIGSNWEIGAPEVTNILNQALAKWGHPAQGRDDKW